MGCRSHVKPGGLCQTYVSLGGETRNLNSVSEAKRIVCGSLTMPLYPLGTGVTTESPPTGGQPRAARDAKQSPIVECRQRVLYAQFSWSSYSGLGQKLPDRLFG